MKTSDLEPGGEVEEMKAAAGFVSDEGLGRRGRLVLCWLVLPAAAAAALLFGLLWSLVFSGGLAQTSEVSGSEKQQCHRAEDGHAAAAADSNSKRCPPEWSLWRGRCFFFSEELLQRRQWNESAEFCRQRGSSLAVITDAAEMDFIQTMMRTFSRTPFLWVGLTDVLQEGHWTWLDGSDLQHYLPCVKVEWDAENRDCADLRGGGEIFAAQCDAHGPWLCKRDAQHSSIETEPLSVLSLL